MSSDVRSIGMGAGERIDQLLEYGTVRVERRWASYSYRFFIGYGLFLLTTATLFLRPGEIIPALEHFPIFQILILTTAAVAHPELLEQLRLERLMRFPALLCMLGMPVAIFLSQVLQLNLYGARTGPMDFLKCTLFFFLLLGLVNNLSRLRRFLAITILAIVAMSVLAVLVYYGFVHLAMQAVLERGDGGFTHEGTQIFFQQLQATGIFSDPNDLALVLVLAFLGTLYFITESRSLLARILWCAPAFMLLFAFALTKSRGGLLSLVGGVGVWMLSRYGWRRAMLLGVLVAPIVLVAFAGRQTEISLDEGTAQSRLMHWRDGIGMVKSSPVTGVGYGMFSDLSGNAAHNSFLHCYAELGFLGGTLFFGLFLLPILALTSTKTQAFLQSVGEFIIPPAQVLAEERQPLRELDQETDRLRSCMLAIIIAYGIGLFALSRSYAVSTYLMLGMVCAMGIIIAGKNPAAVKRLTTRTVAILITTSGCWLVFLYLLVKLLLKAGATK